MIRGYFESLPADRFPNVHAALDELFSGGPEERFELGLDVIIRGLASYVTPARQPARRGTDRRR
jgi:hypothetical protein